MGPGRAWGSPSCESPSIRTPTPICTQEMPPLPHGTPRPPMAGPHPHPLHPSEGLTMGGARRLLPQPHICRGKRVMSWRRGRPGILQDLRSCARATVPSHGHSAGHGTAHPPPPWARQPQTPGSRCPQPPLQPWGQAQPPGTARHSTARQRTHPPQLRAPPGCPAGPPLPRSRCHLQVPPPRPRPAALQDRGTGQPGPSLPRRGHPGDTPWDRHDHPSVGCRPWCGTQQPMSQREHRAGLTPTGSPGSTEWPHIPIPVLEGTHPHPGHEAEGGSACPRAGHLRQSHAPMPPGTAALVPVPAPVWNSMVLSISAT